MLIITDNKQTVNGNYQKQLFFCRTMFKVYFHFIFGSIWQGIGRYELIEVKQILARKCLMVSIYAEIPMFACDFAVLQVWFRPQKFTWWNKLWFIIVQKHYRYPGNTKNRNISKYFLFRSHGPIFYQISDKLTIFACVTVCIKKTSQPFVAESEEK